MTYKLRGAQVVSETTDKGLFIVRASQYLNEKNENIYRISVIAKNEIIEMRENIKTLDECKKLFEDYQKTHYGYVKKELHDNLFA
jgi:hypothetical protein